MSTSGADRAGQAGQADRAGESGRAGQTDRAGHPAGLVPAARTTAGTGRAAGETAEPDTGALLPGQRPPDLTRLRLPELRALRRDSQRDEADLSYLRRLLQGRIDILRDELSRRTGRMARTGAQREPGAVREPEPPREPEPARERSEAWPPEAARTGPRPAAGPSPTAGARPGDGPTAAADMVVRLAEILSDAPSQHRTSARHVTLSTPRGAECRRLAAETLAEVELSDLAARTDDELHAAMRRFVRNEQQISRRRHQLQRTVDGCSAEIARRYREGEAQVDDLLT